ncbi:TetR family transcriptional regulator [Gordonia sp. CPCC 205515]|uniref:TetR family transcriptional regulator n=1 Tax=Gordonia sp. CPCC 205515 TaxID=3140791 RepID=UPI003AF3DE00
MAPSDSAGDDFRMRVVTESIRLFADSGYESTTVEQIASAAGISRRTFFRQFGSKEDVIFADHETLLHQVEAQLDADSGDPWVAVCESAELVFVHFLAIRDLAIRRLRVVQQVPALRERELVTTYRYQRLFEDYLRRVRPDESRVRIVAYAAAITGAHNYLLRSMIRGDKQATLERLRAELSRIRTALSAVAAVGELPAVAVVTYPPGTPAEEVGRLVGEQLRAEQRKQGH